MVAIERSITVKAPLDVVYATWANFQNFPAYTPHVVSVEKLKKRRTRWVVDVVGYRLQFEAELDEERPNRMISWHSVSTIKHFGSTYVLPEAGGTKVTVRLTVDMESLPAHLVDELNVSWHEFEETFEDALHSFKRYVEHMWRQVPAAV
ncbi:MAG TPA: SRPBCC family protein [Anaerolineae bacterium]|nr:SRPBCC family protein [Anaerolineae bacterium]